MVNKPKIIGTRFETDVVNYLRMVGYDRAERRALTGQNDRGDIAGTNFVWECKATKSIDLASGMTELNQEIINAETPYGFLIVKRRNKPTKDAYAVMSLEQLCQILRDAYGV